MLVTATHLVPCHSMMGTHVTMLSIKNKADYAKMHGYGFHWATEEPDPLMQGAWNKIAVLQMVADKYSESEVGWFLWVDSDTLILDMDRPLPVERYEGRDIVVWGCSPDLLDNYNALGTLGCSGGGTCVVCAMGRRCVVHNRLQRRHAAAAQWQGSARAAGAAGG